MQTIQKTISLSEKPQITKDLFTENTFFFDIETTGFSPKRTSLYMIGYAVREKENALITQLLADDPSEEELLLKSFFDNISGLSRMISFNGSGFDLPYLKEKLSVYSLDDPFPGIEELDIFSSIRSFRQILSLPNMKQKTVEDFLSIRRKDTHTGGDLIPVYRHYSATGDDLPKGLLLLHNFEDVLGMIDSLPALSYPALFDGGFSLTDYKPGKETVSFRLTPQYPFPVSLTIEREGISLSLNEDTARLSIPVFSGELKYFFPDPENYYYLPEEDTAIHKSVGGYVDKSHRKQATKSTAYIKKEGDFLPQPREIYTPAFRITYKAPLSYFELPAAFDLTCPELFHYINTCLQFLLQAK